ncbi:MAG: glycoside hydrolase family 43 protein [bacterium]
MNAFAEPAASGTAFYPGRLWLDDQGTPINAHGGGVMFHEGTYYWFGEHKIEGSAGNVAHVGVRSYSSHDLYHWTGEGVALWVSDDPGSDIAKGCILERPKVIRNPKTGKFVMYFHLELKGQGYSAARTGIAIADKPAGPYSFVRSLRPNAGQWPLNVKFEQKSPESIASARAAGDHFSGGPDEKLKTYNVLGAHVEGGQMSRDMTLFVDDDGKAYHVYASEHNSTLHIAELTDDYLGYSGKYVRVFEHRWMEAPAICKRKGKYYFLASGCTGWTPNAARSAVADSIWGPWTELGNPCEGTNPANGLGPDKTFGGQSTFILPVQGKEDAFIALFDIWRPDNAIDGRYAWLPITFTDKGFKIKWQDTWDLRRFVDKAGAGVAGKP